jgi:hypothetical protein
MRKLSTGTRNFWQVSVNTPGQARVTQKSTLARDWESPVCVGEPLRWMSDKGGRIPHFPSDQRCALGVCWVEVRRTVRPAERHCHYRIHCVDSRLPRKRYRENGLRPRVPTLTARPQWHGISAAEYPGMHIRFAPSVVKSTGPRICRASNRAIQFGNSQTQVSCACSNDAPAHVRRSLCISAAEFLVRFFLFY